MKKLIDEPKEKNLKLPYKYFKLPDNKTYMAFMQGEAFSACSASANTLKEVEDQLLNSLKAHLLFLKKENKKLARLAIFLGFYNKTNHSVAWFFTILGIGMSYFKGIKDEKYAKMKDSKELVIGRHRLRFINLWKR